MDVIFGPTRSCPVCGASAAMHQPIRDRYGLELSVAICLGGCRYLDPAPTQDWYNRFYQTGGYRELVARHRGLKVFDVREMHREQHEYAARLGNVLDQYWYRAATTGVTRPRLLDVGASADDPVAGYLSWRFDVEVVQQGLECDGTTFEEFAVPGGFDLITINQAVDHFLDPHRTLAKARRHLQPNGLLWVDIRRFTEDSDENLYKIDHPVYFTTASMLGLLRRVDLCVVRQVATPSHVGFICEAA